MYEVRVSREVIDIYKVANSVGKLKWDTIIDRILREDMQPEESIYEDLKVISVEKE